MTKKIKSPCKTTCLLDKTSSYCESCFRTVEEITDWASYSHEERKSISKQLPNRKPNAIAK